MPLRQATTLLDERLSGRPGIHEMPVINRSDRSARRLRVFATEPDRVQLTWRRLGPGPVTFSGAGPDVCVATDGGPGAVDLVGLTAETAYQVEARLDASGDLAGRLDVRTIAPPPGDELTRFATVSDIHLGRDTFGLLDRITETPPGEGPVGWRCVVDAVEAAGAWGAARLIGKGDLVDHGSAVEWATLSELAAIAADEGMAMDVLPGNHEVKPYREMDPDPAMAEHGFEPTNGIRVIELDGVRLALIDTTVVNEKGDHSVTGNRGRLDHATAVIGDLVGGQRTMIAQHHFPQPGPVPHYRPLGVPWRESVRFLDELDASAPGAFVTAGHSHRHRRRNHRSVTITEVGSPKDYPGAWAGYVVHEGGIRQVTRRVTRTDCIRWTERTRRAAGGLWELWSPGRLDDRCFSITWPD